MKTSISFPTEKDRPLTYRRGLSIMSLLDISEARMEYLILGLLILSPMTGYELRQFIRQNLALICSDSAGSVQTALAKLGARGVRNVLRERRGQAEKDLFHHGDRTGGVFGVGGAADAGGAGEEHGALAALFPRPRKARGARRGDTRLHPPDGADVGHSLRHPGALPRDADRPAPARRDWEQIFRFQGLTIEYGIAAAEFERGWYTKLLEELEEKP